MSVKRFKIGDKVRVRKGLVADEYYGDTHCADTMAEMSGEVFTIKRIDEDCYRVVGNGWAWSDQMLELVEPNTSKSIVEIDGKKYKEADIEKGIKDLEVVG